MDRTACRGLKTLGAASFLVLLCQGPSAASSYRSLARKLSRQAAEAGIRRLAVLPLVSLDGSEEVEGRHISEQLATELTLRGEVTVVERSLLSEVMEEHRLGQTGALDPATLSRLGALAQAEAVAAGTFVTLGDTAEITVRVVRIETGAVIAASTVRLHRDWFPALEGVIPRPAPISAAVSAAEVYEYQTGRKLYVPESASVPERRVSLRDALRDISDECDGAAQRIDALQESILGLKARYWAGQALKKRFSPAGLAVKPGQVISDPGLRRRFFELLVQEAAQGPRPLTMTEVRQFVAADMQSQVLYQTCGLAALDHGAADAAGGYVALADR